jgi:hypothetical protein
MGATPLVRWQFSHDRWRMGAISLVKVTARGGVCPPNARLGTRAAAMNPTQVIKATRFPLGFDELFIVIDASLTTTKASPGSPTSTGDVRRDAIRPTGRPGHDRVFVTASGDLRKSQNAGRVVGKMLT